MSHIIEISDLSKEYPSFLLDNINIQIPYGKIVGLIGENGAGKTTLISLILNQKKRDEGYIKVFGLDNIKDERKIKKDIGFVVDECCFHNCLNAKNVKSIMKSIYPEWDNSYFESLLKKFDISEIKKISEMSKGMKSKLMLAVAMSHNPRLLILDEVTSGLDPVVRDDILNILKEFVNDETKSVFFSTHITSDLDKIADYIAFLHKGKLVFIKSLEELQQNFLLIKCTEGEYKKINQEDIVIKYKEEGKYILLVAKSTINKDYYQIGEIPTIDDIMLLYIKGENINDWFNKKRPFSYSKES